MTRSLPPVPWSWRAHTSGRGNSGGGVPARLLRRRDSTSGEIRDAASSQAQGRNHGRLSLPSSTTRPTETFATWAVTHDVWCEDRNVADLGRGGWSGPGYVGQGNVSQTTVEPRGSGAIQDNSEQVKHLDIANRPAGSTTKNLLRRRKFSRAKLPAAHVRPRGSCPADRVAPPRRGLPNQASERFWKTWGILVGPPRCRRGYCVIVRRYPPIRARIIRGAAARSTWSLGKARFSARSAAARGRFPSRIGSAVLGIAFCFVVLTGERQGGVRKLARPGHIAGGKDVSLLSVES